MNQFGKLRKSAILPVVVVLLVSDRTGITWQQCTKMKMCMRKQARVCTYPCIALSIYRAVIVAQFLNCCFVVSRVIALWFRKIVFKFLGK